MERFDFELGVINQMGYPGYFLIVADFIQWARRHDIPVGPGRGSGAGSVPAMAQLAEGIQGVVKNMRNEQQMLRDWIEAQQEESQELRRTLQRLTDKLGDR